MNRFAARPLFQPDNEDLRFLPECPRVLHQFPGGALVLGWVAIQHGPGRLDGSINLLNLATGVNTTVPLPGRPGFFVETDRPGWLLVGLDRRLVLVDVTAGRVTETGIVVSDDERVIINDGIAIPNGLLFGTKHLEFRDPIAALYHYDCATRNLHQVVGEQICSNGKHFQDDGDHLTLIDIDSSPKKITRYELDRSLRRVLRQALVTPPDALPALPDGLRASPDGSSVIVAFYNPEAVECGIAQEIRVADGAVLTEWALPGSPRVTCPEFAMIDNQVRVLFTTAVEGMTADIRRMAPHAGTLFCAETRFTSLPAPPPLVPVGAFR